MKKYKQFEEHLKKIAYLNSSAALLSWDQEVYMPVDANEPAPLTDPPSQTIFSLPLS